MPTHRIQARPAPLEIDSSRTALLVIDMQNVFGTVGGAFDKAGIDITGIQGAVRPTALAVTAARRAGINVFWIKMGFQPDLSDFGAEEGPNADVFLALGLKEGEWTRDQWGTDLVDGLSRQPNEPVIYKPRFSAFFRTALDELLRSYNAKHLIVTGCTTSICIESTIRDAFFRDYHCILLEDCTAEPFGGTLTRTNHEASVLLVERVFGSVSSSAAFLEAVQAADGETV